MSLNADPYRTLGLTRGASLDDVKRAYRRLAKANHPDVAGGAALPRFLAIRAAYEQIAGRSAAAMPGGRTAPAARRRQASTEADRRGAAASGAGAAPGRSGRPAPGRSGRAAPGSRPGTGWSGSDTAGPAGPRAPGTAAPGAGKSAGKSAGRTGTPGGRSQSSPGRGKATLGSTSYDGADSGPFEPDWGGASWYGTSSGTYWTINPKEYADPRKHGPEYQARARRAAGTPGVAGTPGAAGTPGVAGARDARPRPAPGRGGGASGSSTHTTRSWWDSTSGPEPDPDDFASDDEAQATSAAWANRATGTAHTRAHAHLSDSDGPAPDPARAAIDLGRALTDPRSGGRRGRAVRAALGWLPIALGLGWLVGELSGCGRFAATCDPVVAPLTAAGQAIVLAVLFLVPEIAAIAAGAALVLLATASAATLILSATGTAADEASRRAALGALLMVAWLSGLGIAVVRRLRSGRSPARPVS